VPVGEHCVTGPHRSDVLATVGIGQEYTAVIAISVDAVIVAGIVGVGDVDGRINDAEAMLVPRLVRVFSLTTHGM